jgi:putative redox protein
MKANVTWQQGMNFMGKANSGFAVQMDADRSVGGNENGIRPMEMIALGLAGCTAMDVISILQKKRQNVTDFEVMVDAARSADHPKVFTNAVITYIVSGHDVEESALLRSIELSVTKYCPVQAMLEQAFPMDLCYEIYEDEGGGNKHLVHQGVWQNLIQE